MRLVLLQLPTLLLATFREMSTDDLCNYLKSSIQSSHVGVVQNALGRLRDKITADDLLQLVLPALNTKTVPADQSARRTTIIDLLVAFKFDKATAASEIPLLMQAIQQLNVDGVRVMLARLENGGVSYYDLTTKGLIDVVRGLHEGDDKRVIISLLSKFDGADGTAALVRAGELAQPLAATSTADDGARLQASDTRRSVPVATGVVARSSPAAVTAPPAPVTMPVPVRPHVDEKQALEIIRQILNEELKYVSEPKATPLPPCASDLIAAVLDKDSAGILRLVGAGRVVNCDSGSGLTPLMRAGKLATSPKNDDDHDVELIATVNALLDAGADKNLLSDELKTAENYAELDYDISDLLRPDTPPLIAAVKRHDISTVENVCSSVTGRYDYDNRANRLMGAEDGEGRTALQWAIVERQVYLVDLLKKTSLKYGAWENDMDSVVLATELSKLEH